MKKIINIALAAACGLLLWGCTETLEYAKEEKNAPVIESFSPTSAPIGSTITIEGKYLNRVNVVKIGGEEVTIAERISNTRLTVIATSAGKDGTISVTNPFGTGTSEGSFTYSYVAPEITTIPASVNMGDNMAILGTNLGVAEAAFFTADGFAGHEAHIVSVNAAGTEMIVRVPYVEANEAKISFKYFNGTAVIEGVKSSPLTIVRNAPTVTTTTFARTAVGRSFTIAGTYLDKIDIVTVGGFNASVSSKTATALTFTIPAGDFVDGDNNANIVISYFDGNETQEIAPLFVVYVPYVKFWENIRTWTQGRTGLLALPNGAFTSFFSPETGVTYWNGDWKTLVDPISDKYQATVCTAVNAVDKNVISEADYNSVAPYFFFSGSASALNLQINSPANSNSQLRNFYYEDNSNARIMTGGSSSTSCYGTPMMTFRLLSAGNPTELAVINAVKDQTLEKIDETTFPIDVAGNKIGGIGVASAAGSPASNTGNNAWSPDCVSTEKLNVNVDAVLLVIYYTREGVNIANVKRLGLLHIKTVNFRPTSSAATFNSDILFNCYWQKYDYDYSKL